MTRAQSDYDEALRITPDLAAALSGRGNVHLARNDLDRAIADYDRAIALGPDAVTYSNRARAWRAKGDFTRAIADLE